LIQEDKNPRIQEYKSPRIQGIQEPKLVGVWGWLQYSALSDLLGISYDLCLGGVLLLREESISEDNLLTASTELKSHEN
jgi:hypothetical protein